MGHGEKHTSRSTSKAMIGESHEKRFARSEVVYSTNEKTTTH